MEKELTNKHVTKLLITNAEHTGQHRKVIREVITKNKLHLIHTSKNCKD